MNKIQGWERSERHFNISAGKSIATYKNMDDMNVITYLQISEMPKYRGKIKQIGYHLSLAKRNKITGKFIRVEGLGGTFLNKEQARNYAMSYMKTHPRG